MKKYFLGIVAIVLALGFSAFTTMDRKVTKSGSQSFIWHKYNPAGTAELSPTVWFEGTIEEASAYFQCPEGNSVFCARAYDVTIPLDYYIVKSPE